MKEKTFEKFRLDILWKSLTLTILVAVVSFVLGKRYFSIGYIVGFLVATASFANTYTSIRKITSGQVKRIKIYLASKFLLLYFVLALALITSFTKDKLMFVGVISGFISIRIILFIDGCARST